MGSPLALSVPPGSYSTSLILGPFCEIPLLNITYNGLTLPGLLGHWGPTLVLLQGRPVPLGSRLDCFIVNQGDFPLLAGPSPIAPYIPLEAVPEDLYGSPVRMVSLGSIACYSSNYIDQR